MLTNPAHLVALLAVGMSGSLMAQTAPTSPVPPPPSPERIREQVAQCGVPVARVTIRDEPTLQESVIGIAAGPPLGAEQLACIARASLAASTYVELDVPDQQKRYQAVYFPIEASKDRADARNWLAARGLLTKLPSYDPTRQSLAAYGRELEAVCGVRQGAVLTAIGATVTIRRELLAPSARQPSGGAMTDGQFECLLNASTASNMREHGAGFGFIGNAAAPARLAVPSR